MTKAPGRTRKLLLGALIASLAPAWSIPPAAAVTSGCTDMDTWNGLYCNDGSWIEYCVFYDGCAISCGQGYVDVPCD
jgi:hypothetical protein